MADGDTDVKMTRNRKIFFAAIAVGACGLGLWAERDRIPVVANLTSKVMATAGNVGTSSLGGNGNSTAGSATPAPTAQQAPNTAPAVANTASTTPPASSPTNGVSLSGVPRVVSGDQLFFDGVMVTLGGINAPHPGDTCSGGSKEDIGAESKVALAMLIAGKPLNCSGGAGGLICKLPDGTDLNALMARGGWAVGIAGTPYEAMTADAVKAKSGIWGVCPQ